MKEHSDEVTDTKLIKKLIKPEALKKEAFERGFVKAAISSGVNPIKAVQLLKQAFDVNSLLQMAKNNPTATGAIGGGLIGAGGGALMGGKKNRMGGALAGGLLGAGMGGLGGHYLGNQPTPPSKVLDWMKHEQDPQPERLGFSGKLDSPSSYIDDYSNLGNEAVLNPDIGKLFNQSSTGIKNTALASQIAKLQGALKNTPTSTPNIAQELGANVGSGSKIIGKGIYNTSMLPYNAVKETGEDIYNTGKYINQNVVSKIPGITKDFLGGLTGNTAQEINSNPQLDIVNQLNALKQLQSNQQK